MKVYLRKRSWKYYGNPAVMFPYQAVLWFRKENLGEIPFHEAAKFHTHLTKHLGWSYGALGRVASQIVTNDDNTSVGILFNHLKYAQEAIGVYRLYIENKRDYPQ